MRLLIVILLLLTACAQLPDAVIHTKQGRVNVYAGYVVFNGRVIEYDDVITGGQYLLIETVDTFITLEL